MMNDDRYYHHQIRADFAIQNPNALYQPGRVSGEGTLALDSIETSVYEALMKKASMLQAVLGEDGPGPNIEELEASYRV